MATRLKEITALRGLRCRACAALQPADERYVCAECLGPLEPEYDLGLFETETLRADIERGPASL
jgi:threonine synthase